MFSKLTVAALTAALLGTPGAVGAVYLCAGEGTVHRDACCCASEHEGTETPEVAAEEPACCTLSATPREAPAVPATEATPHVVPAPPAVAMIPAAPAPPARAEPISREGTPGPAPPCVYLANCAFLI